MSEVRKKKSKKSSSQASARGSGGKTVGEVTLMPFDSVSNLLHVGLLTPTGDNYFALPPKKAAWLALARDKCGSGRPNLPQDEADLLMM